MESLRLKSPVEGSAAEVKNASETRLHRRPAPHWSCRSGFWMWHARPQTRRKLTEPVGMQAPTTLWICFAFKYPKCWAVGGMCAEQALGHTWMRTSRALGGNQLPTLALYKHFHGCNEVQLMHGNGNALQFTPQIASAKKNRKQKFWVLSWRSGPDRLLQIPKLINILLAAAACPGACKLGLEKWMIKLSVRR